MNSPEFGSEIRGGSTSASCEQMAALNCGAKPKDENITAKSVQADVWTDPLALALFQSISWAGETGNKESKA